MKKHLFTASWILLLVMSLAIGTVSVISLGVAYYGKQDNLTEQITLEKIKDAGGEEAVKAYRGRRATAATWALGWAILSILIVLVPYRTGHRWAWWAQLLSIGLSQLLSLARAPVLDMGLGANPSALLLAIAAVALIAGAPRLFARAEESGG
jgi:hypothetical protein